MALTQMQLIQSLGEALAWFEREVNWGVPATELRHLCGRIGELYVAMITNGQMAQKVNQQGYDVVAATGERISVKTTAMNGSSGHVSFNSNSLHLVDRVIVLRINTDEMQVEMLLDKSVSEITEFVVHGESGRKVIPLSRLIQKKIPIRNIKSVKEVSFREYCLKELESGSIEVFKDGKPVVPAKPVLRILALELGVALLNNNGNPLNTRHLGSLVIKSLQERLVEESPQSDAPERASPVVS